MVTRSVSPSNEDRGERRLREWPAPMHPLAYTGLVGDIVGALEPHSEADPAAMAVQVLVAFGNAVGRSPNYRVEGDEHHMNMNALIVGGTSIGRKGVPWARVRGVMNPADPSWGERNTSGLSSGEGLVWHVRDPEEAPAGESAVGEKRRPARDLGVGDKRLMVVETEFAGVIGVMSRDGSTLSSVIRDAWDDRPLRTLTKHNPVRATGAHVSILGHITADELRRRLSAGDVANGFMNRFLLVCARRSKELPDGGKLTPEHLLPLSHLVREALEHGRTIGAMRRDEGASALWHQVYGPLSAGTAGMLGAVTSRAEAQVLRLQCLYALLDHSEIVRRKDLLAALAVWDYVHRSSEFLFGDLLGNPDADAILEALRSSGASGMTRTEIQRQVFASHGQADEIDPALEQLASAGLARSEEIPTGGRPRSTWFPTGAIKGEGRWLADLLHAHSSLLSPGGEKYDLSQNRSFSLEIRDKSDKTPFLSKAILGGNAPGCDESEVSARGSNAVPLGRGAA